MELRSQSLGRVPTWSLRFLAKYIPPLNAALHLMSQRYASKALEAYLAGEMESAVTDYREAIRWQPHDPKMHSALGQVYYELGKLDEAERQFKKALDDDYQDLRALKGQGSLLQERGDLAKARYTYLRYLEVEPKDALVLHNLGAVLHNMGKYDEALGYYERAEKEDPTDALLRKNQALAFSALGRTEEARKALLEAGRLAPEDGEVDRLVGLALVNERKYDEALQRFRSAIAKDPEDADSHLELASACAQLKDLSRAVEHAQIAADLFLRRNELNGASAAYWELGWVFYLLGKFDESLNASTNALGLNPNLAPVYFNLGLVLLHMGRDAEARKRYDDGVTKLVQLAELEFHAIRDLRDALSRNPQLKGGAEILSMLETQYATALKNVDLTLGKPDGTQQGSIQTQSPGSAENFMASS